MSRVGLMRWLRGRRRADRRPFVVSQELYRSWRMPDVPSTPEPAAEQVRDYAAEEAAALAAQRRREEAAAAEQRRRE